MRGGTHIGRLGLVLLQVALAVVILLLAGAAVLVLASPMEMRATGFLG